MRASITTFALAGILTLNAQAQNRTDNCVEDNILNGDDANQTIVLKNYCSRIVDFAICVDRSDNSWDEFRRGRISPGDSRYLYVNGVPLGGHYDYFYNWCFGDACEDMRVPDC